MSNSRFMEARNAAHHAAQVISAWGATHLGIGKAPAEVHELANLGWDAKLDALVSRRAHGLTAGLRIESFTWFLARGGEILAERGVAGSTLSEGLQWLANAGAAAGAPTTPLVPAEYPLPAHEVASGAPFPPPDAEALTKLASLFATAQTVLGELMATEPGASEVRVWPHHFDQAMLITLDPNMDPEEARSVGPGMEPGDEGIEEPYFAVTLWPRPEQAPVAPLAHGRWHHAGWTGALLTQSEWDGELNTLRAFYQDALAKARELLGA